MARSTVFVFVSTGCAAALPAASAYNPGRDVLFRIHAIDQKPVAGINRVDAAQVGKNQIPVRMRILSQFDDMMKAVDKVDSGDLTIDEIQHPSGWILIGFPMDPRTGLGRWRNFTILLRKEHLQGSHLLSLQQDHPVNLSDVQISSGL
mgnify:CR=1 FL=1